MTKLYPPRPETAIEPRLIKYYEGKNWIGQIKKNGTCTVIDVDDDGNVEFYTRKGEKHKAWTPTPEIVHYFSQHKGSVFVGELLHSKGPSVKNTIYLFDILRYHGLDFVGYTLEKRYGFLTAMCKPQSFIWIAKNHKGDLTRLFKELRDPLDEGLVLKDPFAVLKDCHRRTNNTGWQVKVRRPTKNYGF